MSWWSTATGCRRAVCPRWNKAWWSGSWSLQTLWSSATVTTRFWCAHFEWTSLSHTGPTGRVLGLALDIEVFLNTKSSSCCITTGFSWTDIGDCFPVLPCYSPLKIKSRLRGSRFPRSNVLREIAWGFWMIVQNKLCSWGRSKSCITFWTTHSSFHWVFGLLVPLK